MESGGGGGEEIATFVDNAGPRPPGGVYDYFSGGYIESGLTTKGQSFMLNNKPIKILSGAIHYFRVHPEYWKDRLLKLRAAGFNTVET